VVQVVEDLPSKCETLSSNASTKKKTKKSWIVICVWICEKALKQNKNCSTEYKNFGLITTILIKRSHMLKVYFLKCLCKIFLSGNPIHKHVHLHVYVCAYIHS
jgi:hypothetical protein